LGSLAISSGRFSLKNRFRSRFRLRPRLTQRQAEIQHGHLARRIA
jgi:hypothetical protein